MRRIMEAMSSALETPMTYLRVTDPKEVARLNARYERQHREMQGRVDAKRRKAGLPPMKLPG